MYSPLTWDGGGVLIVICLGGGVFQGWGMCVTTRTPVRPVCGCA